MVYNFKTDKGVKRDINEDFVCIRKVSNNFIIFTVADGLGGYESGEVASKKCCTEISDFLEENYLNMENEKELEKYIRLAVQKVNISIMEMQKEKQEYQKMATTLVMCIKYFNLFYFLSIGDSRIYYISKDKKNIVKLTTDDTYVNELYKNNKITKEEMYTHSQRHVLTKAVGVNEKIDFDIKCLDYKYDGYIFMCSDGISGVLSKDQILNTFKKSKFENFDNNIISKAIKSGSNDNLTSLTISIREV